MMEMTEQTDFENKKLNETMDEEIDDTEEGEILEDGEIADEEDISDKKDDIKVEEKENNNNRDKDINKERDSRKKEDSSRKSDENKSRDKDKDRDRNRDRERDKERDRRHVYERTDRSDRDRKSADRDRKSSNDDDRDKRRRDRDRKRRRSGEEEDRDKRKRSRDQNWDFNESNNSRNNFDDYDRRFEEMDFRLTDPSFTNSNALHHSSEEEDFNFDERDFEEMLQIMEHRMPTNRTDAMPSTEKRAMMRAMAIMMKRNLDSDTTRRLASFREKRRTRDRTPGPTGTRATPRQTERTDRTQTEKNFKPLCKFFVEGKCHKGSDCSYSHETSPSKKKEICKFYLQGFCGKGSECLFMHNEFPCKFFHTNVECYSGDNCRFSHSPLNDETRQILRNYLDSGQLPDDPKPDKNEMHPKNESIKTEENNPNNSNNNNNINNSQTNTNSTPSSSTYAPMKPVAKRHAVLGDATQEMKTSYYTWVWQQEMKELEVAYVGNKRNLFCIESKFVIADKPPTPRMEDDEEEIEAQIRSYYMETMGDNFENEGTEVSNKGLKSEEQMLIEASAHDEDLRTIPVRPRNSANESIDNKSIIKNEEQENQLINDSPGSQSKSQSNEVPTNLPKVARDLYMKMQNKIQTESESKSSWLSDSDDDDKDEHVLAAALKNVQQQKSNPKSSSVDKSKRTIDISKMLSAIRQSSNTTPANTSTKQSEFWQNILSGINLAGSSPSGNNTPPRNDYRDPRLKRGKDMMSPKDATPPVKICDPNVIIEYKLLPLTPTDIDYSCYVSIYRIDSRLKNDPRLQKFFAKLPTSEIDNLSRIVPPPLKTAPVTPLSVLKSKKKSEKEKRDKKVKPNSPTLPPLPPLTISPSKSAPTPGIIPPTPPPIMSPFELISSRPTFTVGENKSPNNTKEMNANVVIKEETIDLKSPQSVSSPESFTQSEDNEKQSKSDPKRLPTILPLNLNESVTIAANPLPSTTIDIKPLLSSSPPQLSTPLSSTTLNTELYETSFDTNLTNTETEKDEQKPNDEKEATNNGSTDDDLYDNLYAPITDLSKTGPQYSVSSSSSLIEDELEMIRNELQAPVIDSDNEMEIDIRERQDSVSEVESADECELTIASSSETEDNNIDNDMNNRNSVINDNNNAINLMQSNNQLNDEPINLALSDVQNNEISDQSLKSVFSTIDPTASPFC
jgi:hypothetical protein